MATAPGCARCRGTRWAMRPFTDEGVNIRRLAHAADEPGSWRCTSRWKTLGGYPAQQEKIFAMYHQGEVLARHRHRHRVLRSPPAGAAMGGQPMWTATRAKAPASPPSWEVGLRSSPGPQPRSRDALPRHPAGGGCGAERHCGLRPAEQARPSGQGWRGMVQRRWPWPTRMISTDPAGHPAAGHDGVPMWREQLLARYGDSLPPWWRSPPTPPAIASTTGIWHDDQQAAGLRRCRR